MMRSFLPGYSTSTVPNLDSSAADDTNAKGANAKSENKKKKKEPVVVYDDSIATAVAAMGDVSLGPLSSSLSPAAVQRLSAPLADSGLVRAPAHNDCGGKVKKANAAMTDNDDKDNNDEASDNAESSSSAAASKPKSAKRGGKSGARVRLHGGGRIEVFDWVRNERLYTLYAGPMRPTSLALRLPTIMDHPDIAAPRRFAFGDHDEHGDGDGSNTAAKAKAAAAVDTAAKQKARNAEEAARAKRRRAIELGGVVARDARVAGENNTAWLDDIEHVRALNRAKLEERVQRYVMVAATFDDPTADAKMGVWKWPVSQTGAPLGRSQAQQDAEVGVRALVPADAPGAAAARKLKLSQIALSEGGRYRPQPLTPETLAAPYNNPNAGFKLQGRVLKAIMQPELNKLSAASTGLPRMMQGLLDRLLGNQ